MGDNDILKFNLGVNHLFTIIPPSQFIKIPWKNGKGTTNELAISDSGTVDDFDWRLSIADVVEDGPFSDFSGYQRNLLLIKGKGIHLQHDQQKTNQLDQLLDMATFDGANQTTGKLIAGPVTDFNLITRQGKYHARVNTYRHKQSVELDQYSLCFVYCLAEISYLSAQESNLKVMLPAGHLLKILEPHKLNLSITGQQMIVIHLIPD